MTLIERVIAAMQLELISTRIIDLEEERCNRDPVYRNNTYVERVTALRDHSTEILDALLDATPKKPYSFRSGMIPLLKEDRLCREYACNAFKVYVAPVVAKQWYPQNGQQFIRDILRALRESPYQTAIQTINTWGKAITRNPLWNITTIIMRDYSTELHETYMKEIEKICNFNPKHQF